MLAIISLSLKAVSLLPPVLTQRFCPQVVRSALSSKLKPPPAPPLPQLTRGNKIPPAPPPPPLFPRPAGAGQGRRQKVPSLQHHLTGKHPAVFEMPPLPSSPVPIVNLPMIPPPPPAPIEPIGQKPTIQIPIFPLEKLIASSERYVIVDTEGTGLGSNQALTEIGCVEVKNFQITGNQFQCYINPECEVGAEAHRLTGLTWHFLSQHPTFEQAGPSFMKFSKGATLVFHDASNDLKWLKSSLKLYGYSSKGLEQQKFLDTFQIARKLHPNDKKSLTALCVLYGIDTKHRDKHGALVDAELLAELFCKLVRKDDSILGNATPAIDMEQFDAIHDTPGEVFLRANGITGDLPGFRFSPTLYHPESKKNYPAVLIPFMKEGVCSGVYVRYLVNNLEKSKQEEPGKKIFYGIPENASLDIYAGGLKTLFIGNLINALVARDILLDKQLSEYLGVQDSFGIKACVDLACLSSLTFDPQTKEVVVVIGPDTNHVDGRKALMKMLEHCRGKHISLKAVILQSGREEKNSTTELARQYPEQLVECMRHIIPINDEQELDALFSSKTLKWMKELNTIKQARKTYESAKPITPGTPAFKYFHRRGITGALPQALRWAELYYPWLQKKLPAIVAPMYDAKGDFSAVHQIFCYEDGSPLPKKLENLDTTVKRRNKITWGKASGAAIEFTNTGELIKPEDQRNVVFVGEGLENTLIIAQTMAAMKTSNPTSIKKLYKKFGITDTFLFQACLGVNDVKQAPLTKTTKTVVLLADNDGRKNLEANKAVRDSARFFLESGHRVHIVFPFLPEGEKKWDFNDVHSKATGDPVSEVAAILLDAFEISKREELGEDTEPLEDSLKALKESRSGQQVTKTDNGLEREFQNLLADPAFRGRFSPPYKQGSAFYG